MAQVYTVNMHCKPARVAYGRLETRLNAAFGCKHGWRFRGGGRRPGASMGLCPPKFVVFVTFVSMLSSEEYRSTPM